jgi:dTMP kinase
MVALFDDRATVIAFHGIDGSGKSTVAEALRDRLRHEGVTTSLVKTESGRSGLDRLSRKLGHADLGAMVGAETATMMEAAIGWRSIRATKALLRSPRSVVLFDRHAACHLALAAMRSPAVIGDVRTVFSPFRRADQSILVTIDPTVATQRLAARGGTAHTADFLTAFQQAYLTLDEASGFTVVDGGGSPGDVLEQVWAVVDGSDQAGAAR